MYWCYVIFSSTRQQYYIGVTDDVSRRVQDHNNGISKWTKGKGPWLLEWTKEFTSLSEARKFENLLKRQKGGDGFYQLTGIGHKVGS
jgi:putative endonuclease